MHALADNAHWQHDPLGEYRWLTFKGPLSKFVDALWIFGQRGHTVSNQMLVPHWKICLAVTRKWDIVSGQLRDVRLSLLGPVKAPRWNIGSTGVEIIAIRLNPESVSALLDVRPADIVDSDPILKPRARLDHVRRLAESGAHADCVGTAMVAYLAEIASIANSRVTPSASGAAMIRLSFGRLRVSDIADTLHVPERTFRRQFEHDIGLSPKQYSRRVRLMGLLLCTDRLARPNWSALAHDFGFFDQAHLIEDTRLLTGLGPSQLHAMRRNLPVHEATRGLNYSSFVTG